MSVRTEAISVRVAPELKAEIEKMAAADGRSVSSYVERLLAQHVEEKAGKKRSGYTLDNVG